MKTSKDLERELKGVKTYEFLKSEYKATFEGVFNGKHNFQVTKISNGHSYRVRFQFARLSFLNLPNDYRAFSCNCPRFHTAGNCHHLLCAAQTHAESIGQTLDAETFAEFQLSQANQSKMEKLAA